MTDRDRGETGERLPPVVGVAGPSGSGKTTLVERLVDAFAAEGRRVATVKSIHHAIEPDDPGTDTHRHRTAGAAETVGITPDHAFAIRPHEPGETGGDSGEPDADARKRAALRNALRRFAAAGYDLVVVEGFDEVSVPTLRVGVDAPSDAATDDVAGETVAAVADPDDPAEAVLDAVRALDPPESIDRALDPRAAEPTDDDTQDR